MSEVGPRVLAVVPARGGSKAPPRKNIRHLNGAPLLAYTLATAMDARDLLYRTIVSTDDEEIRTVAQDCGGDVPFLRPAELSSDTASMAPVLQHAVAFVEEQDGVLVDWAMLLQPTVPFRDVVDIRASINLASVHQSTSVISVVRVYAHHPILMKRIVGDRLESYCLEEREGTRRQDYEPPAYMRNGAVYLTRRDVLMGEGSLWGNHILPYVMPEERSLNIDSESDFLTAEAILRRRVAAAEHEESFHA